MYYKKMKIKITMRKWKEYTKNWKRKNKIKKIQI